MHSERNLILQCSIFKKLYRLFFKIYLNYSIFVFSYILETCSKNVLQEYGKKEYELLQPRIVDDKANTDLYDQHTQEKLNIYSL